MEESANGKRSRNNDEKEEPDLKKIKLESADKSDGESGASNTIVKQEDVETAEEMVRELSSMRKLKSELDEEKVNEDQIRIQHEMDKKIRKDEESHILRLFTHVLNTVLDEKEVKDDDVAESLIELKDSYKLDERKRIPTFHNIDFTKWEYICSYLYRYTSHGAGFTRFQTLHAIRNCEYVEKVLAKSNLNIICLGSGPGNDFVGMCSALAEVQYPASLTMTLVDKFENWRFCTKLAELFVKEGNYGKVSELFQKTDVKLQFVQTNLPGDLKLNKKYFQCLAKADIILMTKLVTILDRSNYAESERSIIQSLYENTKRGAIVLLNDTYLDSLWMDFHRLYTWERGDQNKYQSTALAEDRFNYYDNTSSKLSLHVLVKERDLDYCQKICSACV